MFTGKLRDFQVPAHEMAVARNSLIAYDKGLGKTVIATSAVEEMIERDEVRCGLITTPASLKYQWARKIGEFTDGAVTVKAVGDTAEERNRAYREYDEGVYDYLILSYNNAVDDARVVRRLPRDFMVLDEITAIKGFKSQRSKVLKSMSPRVRLGLTASPIENRPEELFSILQWVDRRVLGDATYFDRCFIKRDKYGAVKYYRNLDKLYAKVSEVMARKTWADEDVRDEMPRIVETVRTVPFDRASARLYNRIRDELLVDLSSMTGGDFDVFAHYAGEASFGDAKQRGLVMQKLTALRMLCDHPELLRMSAERFAEWDEERRTKAQHGSRYAAQLHADGYTSGLYDTPKMDYVLDYIDEVLTTSAQNKIVLFSYFKPTVHLFAQALAEEQDVRSVVYHGDMTPKAKDRAAVAFAEDPDIRVFLATDAGGYGLDIPEANYLINYDLPWSAGALGQRNGRIMRLSSRFSEVHFTHFLMQNSVEVRQYAMLEAKNAIASAVLDGVGIDRYGKLKLDLDTLRSFLEERAA